MQKEKKRKRVAIAGIAILVTAIVTSLSIGTAALVKTEMTQMTLEKTETAVTQVQDQLDVQIDKINKLSIDVNRLQYFEKLSINLQIYDSQLSVVDFKLQNLLIQVNELLTKSKDYYKALLFARQGMVTPVLLPTDLFRSVINETVHSLKWKPLYSETEMSRYYSVLTVKSYSDYLSITVPFKGENVHRYFAIHQFPSISDRDNKIFVNSYKGDIVVNENNDKYALMEDGFLDKCMILEDSVSLCDINLFVFRSDPSCALSVIRGHPDYDFCNWQTINISSFYIASTAHEKAIFFETLTEVHIRCSTPKEPASQYKRMRKVIRRVVIPRYCELQSEHLYVPASQHIALDIKLRNHMHISGDLFTLQDNLTYNIKVDNEVLLDKVHWIKLPVENHIITLVMLVFLVLSTLVFVFRHFWVLRKRAVVKSVAPKIAEGVASTEKDDIVSKEEVGSSPAVKEEKCETESSPTEKEETIDKEISPTEKEGKHISSPQNSAHIIIYA